MERKAESFGDSEEEVSMWWFSSFRPDQSKDPFEANINRAIEISRNEEDRAKEESLRQSNMELEKDEKILLEEKKLDSHLAKTNREIFKENIQLNHSTDYVNLPPSMCNGGCNSKIEDGIYVNAFGAICLHCHKPIDVQEISSSKGMFHRLCYKELRRPKCYVCKNKIPSTEEGIKYNAHPFWKEKYCPCHEDDGTAKCCSCERLESWETKYVMLADGRWLCRECRESAIMDTYECHHLHLEIRKFFEGLNVKVEKEFPLFLVEKQALNQVENEEKNDTQYKVVTRGKCLSKEHAVTSVSKGTRMGPNKRLIGKATKSHMVNRVCEVTAILIIYGLPRFLTGYILAHEMMHAYLRLKGYRLNTVLEEGLCQVLGHMWLESIDHSSSCYTTSKKGDQSCFEKRLVEFCKYQIETDDSPIYGLGFKQVHKMMISNNYSLHDTLRQIQRSD